MDHPSKTILIVENDQILSRLLAKAFREEKFTVLEAENGKAGLDAVHASHPDLILLDLDMPGMNGLTMLKALREAGDKTKIIVLTNLNDPEDIAEATAHEVHDYLVKSDWELEDIVAQIKTKFHA